MARAAATGSATTTAASSEAGTADGSSSDGGEASTTGEPAGCLADAMGQGQHDGLVIEHDGAMRRYNLYIPEGLDGTVAAPLVLNFHGLTSNAAQQQLFSQFDPVADANGLVVAYPEGTDASWNAGTCCGSAVTNQVDDVGFARAVIADVKARTCIDAKRVYATGMSNGGFMSHRLACEAADAVAAIAPVAGVIGIPLEDCAPSRPVPVLHFHGTLDPLVPYDGNMLWPGAVQTVAQWSMLDGCPGDPVETFDEAEVHCEASDMCDGGARTELCTVEGGGHCWPGTALCPLGVSTTVLSASERMAEFFAGFSLP
ncbi:MAG: PHB depolymerase family esterase [Nannocystaceae bacterium]